MARETGIISWKELPLGCAIVEPGNASELRTGDWRSKHPVTDFNKCIQCGNCYIYCPDMAYVRNEEGFYESDLYHCKGCGICAKECPKNAISMVEEGH